MNIPKVEDINYDSYSDPYIRIEENYLTLEIDRSRFGEGFSYSIKVDDLLQDEANYLVSCLSALRFPKDEEEEDESLNKGRD